MARITAKQVEETKAPTNLDEIVKLQAEQIARLEAMVRKVSDIDRVNKFDKSENKIEKKKCRLSYFHDEVIIGLDIIGWRPMAGQSGMKEHQYKVTTLNEGKEKTYEVYLGEYVEWVTSKRLSDDEVAYHDIEEIRSKTLILDYFGDKIEVSNKVINM